MTVKNNLFVLFVSSAVGWCSATEGLAEAKGPSGALTPTRHLGKCSAAEEDAGCINTNTLEPGNIRCECPCGGEVAP